jgi:Uma2 family endonuclease
MGRMASVDTSLRPFVPGTTGWSASDLDDPEIERLWFQGRYEIVDGALTTMPPAYFTGGEASSNLLFICQTYVREHRLGGSFAIEADIIVDDSHVFVADFVYLSANDKKLQRLATKRAGRSDPARTRILIPPTLIIESVSPGHEMHDRRTKMRWYAEFGVPNYWILDAFKKSLDCHLLEGSAYRLDVSGRSSRTIRPSLFPGLVVSLAEVWGSD